MKRILLFVLASVLLTACGLFDNYGKKVTVNDKNEVYYKGDGVTEAQARRLGDYLTKTGWFDGKQASSVQLTKDGETYWVKFVYLKDVFEKNRDQIALTFWFLEDGISENVLDGGKTRIALTDNKFKDFDTIDEVNKVKAGDRHSVYIRGSGIATKEAAGIADSLENARFFDYTDGRVVLSKEKGGYAMRFLPDAQKKEESSYLLALSDFRYIIGKYVLGGSNLEMYLMDENYTVAQTIEMTTDERKAYFDGLMNGGAAAPPTE